MFKPEAREEAGDDVARCQPSNAAVTLRRNASVFRPAASMEEKEGSARGLVGAPRRAKTQGRGCPVGTPSGVKTDGTPSNAPRALRKSAPVFRPQTSCTPAWTPRPIGEKQHGAGRRVHWPVDLVSDAWTIPRVPSSEKPGLFYTQAEFARWRRELEEEGRGMAAPAEEAVTAENRDIVGKGVTASHYVCLRKPLLPQRGAYGKECTRAKIAS